MAEPVTIGWREWLELPDLGIDAIKAKVDTGARSSSLHAFDVHEFEQDGTTMVRFKVHPLQRDSHHTVEAEAELVEHRLVRNPGAGGRAEVRPVIRTTVRLAGKRWPIEVTLTRRDAMGFRMLLGRQAVRRRFVVDPGRSFLAPRAAAGARPEQGARKRRSATAAKGKSAMKKRRANDRDQAAGHSGTVKKSRKASAP